jgi:hypothetical protein
VAVAVKSAPRDRPARDELRDHGSAQDRHVDHVDESDAFAGREVEGELAQVPEERPPAADGARSGRDVQLLLGNPGCNNVTQGTKRVIVKYAGGGNSFGGTMSYLIQSGPALHRACGRSGGLSFAFSLAWVRSRPAAAMPLG